MSQPLDGEFGENRNKLPFMGNTEQLEMKNTGKSQRNLLNQVADFLALKMKYIVFFA